MNSKSESQIRHEKLIDFLSQFPQYKTSEGKPRFQKVIEGRSSNKVKDIPVSDIHGTVVVFTDVLNIVGGSIGDIDLYRLLYAYLAIPEYRNKINAIVNEAHTFRYERNK